MLTFIFKPGLVVFSTPLKGNAHKTNGVTEHYTPKFYRASKM